MAFGTRRSSHHIWDDARDTLGDYGDRAHDLYQDGVSRAGGYLDYSRDRAEDVYDRSRRRAAGVYRESRHRAAGAADALAGRRSVEAPPILIAAAAGVLIGAALTAGLGWWMRQRRNQAGVPVAPVTETVDDPFTDDTTIGSATTER